MKRSVVLGVAIGAIVLAASGVSYAAYKVNAQGAEQERKAAVLKAANVVDDEIAAIWSELESCDKQWELGVEKGSAANLTDVLNSTRDTVAALHGDVEDVRALIEDIPSEEVRASYMEVCDLLDAGLDESLRQADATGPCLAAAVLLESAMESRDAGQNSVNASIQACNAKSWSAAKEHAATAQQQYQAVRDAIGQAAATSGSPEVEGACAYGDVLVQYAQQQHELAVLGSKGSINSYNKQIRTLDDLEIQIDERAILMGLAEGGLWREADSVYGHFQLEVVDARREWNAVREDVTSGKM